MRLGKTHFIAAVPVPSGFVAGCIALQYLTALPPAWLLSTLLALAFCLVFLARRFPSLCLIAAVLLGFSWAGWRADTALSNRLAATLEGADLSLTGWVASLPLEGQHATRFLFHVDSCEGIKQGCPVGDLVRLTWSRAFSSRTPLSGDEATALPPAIRPGDRWTLNVRLKRPAAVVNPGIFDAELRMLEEGIMATGYVRRARSGDPPNEQLPGRVLTLGTAFELARQQGIDSLSESLRGARADVRGVLLALSFGDQTAISTPDWEVFNHTGVGHLMSISGLHITMLAAMAGWVARQVLGTRLIAASGLLLRVPALRLQWAFALLTAFVYSGLAGWGIPAQRTCWMLLVTAWAMSSGRTRNILPVLSLAAAVVCVLDPWAPLAAGFWLSFAAVAAIVLHGSFVRRRVRIIDTGDAEAGRGLARQRAVSKVMKTFGEATRTQWAATLSLLPLGALFFSSFSLVSPLANAFAVPLVSCLVTPATLLLAVLSFVWPELAQTLSSVVTAPVAVLLDSLHAMSEWPIGILVIAKPDLVALALSVSSVGMLLYPGPVPFRMLWAVGLLPLVLRGPPDTPSEGFRMTAIDVGQGMAVLVEASGKRLLYDTGPAWDADSDAGARIIVPWLRSRGISRLDLLVVSHADVDHSGGLPGLLRQMPIDRVLSSIPDGHRLREGLRNHRTCRRDEEWVWGSARFRILHPGDEFPSGAARSPTNAFSCVIRIVSPSGTALLAGDIEARQEADLVSRFGKGLQSDVLLVPHHGSNTSSSEAFIAAVAPRIAVFQLGYRNRYRHPAPKVLARYLNADIRVLRTDHHGAIQISFDERAESPVIELGRMSPRTYWRLVPQ